MSTLRVSTLQNAASSTANVTLDTAGNATVGGTLAMGSSFLRNRIINGDMRIWQRGTSGFTNYNYCADRWQAGASAGSTVTQSSDTPTNAGFKYSLSASCTSSSSFLQVYQNIESLNCLDFVGQSVTVSFWLKQTVGSTAIYIQLNYANSVDTFSGTTNISIGAITATSSWARYTVTFNNLPANAANGLQVLIQSQNSSAASTFLITGVQLEVGSVATPFERRQYGQELMLCQRYFINLNGTTNTFQPLAFGSTYSNTGGSYIIYLPVPMRVVPALTYSGTIYAQNININVSSFAGPYSQIGSILEGDLTLASSTTAGTYLFLRWNNVASGSRSFNLSSEL